VVASPVLFEVSSWPFEGANESANYAAEIPRDSKTNDKVKNILTPAMWQKFKGSNSAAVFASPQGIAGGVANYSLATVQKKQDMTNFYDVGNSGVASLTLSEVTGGKVPGPSTLVNYLGAANAVTSPNFGYDRQSAIILKSGILSGANSEFTLVHELLLHAYAAWTDDAIFRNVFLTQQGLWRPAVSTATTSITSWMSTDCGCTPGNPATPTCQPNTAKW
jgi:hypothetical protein